MDLMDDHSNTSSNEISMAVTELNALTQENSPDKEEGATAPKLFAFPRTTSKSLEPIFTVNHGRFFSSGRSRGGTNNNSLTPPGLNVQMNSQYVSKILCPTTRKIGARNTLGHLRMRPYWVPERHRTRSENADSTSVGTLDISQIVEQVSYDTDLLAAAMMDTFDTTEFATATTTSHTPPNYSLDNFSSNVLVTKVRILKKSKSLEELSSDDNIDGSQPSHEMEFVSNRIQKLKVQE